MGRHKEERTKKELIEELKRHRLTINDLRDIIVNNFTDRNHDVVIDDLDFSDVDGDVYIRYLKAPKNLYMCYESVGKDLYQHSQRVNYTIFQDENVSDFGDIYMSDCIAKTGNIYIRDLKCNKLVLGIDERKIGKAKMNVDDKKALEKLLEKGKDD